MLDLGNMREIYLPLDADSAKSLRAGDCVLATGTLFSARDAAHQRFCETLREGGKLPVDLKGQTVFYLGPSPAAPGRCIGACGPTSSYRMDAYTPLLLREGMRAMIGKGKRSSEVIRTMKECGAVYFGAVGGAAAYLSTCVESCECAAYEDLGTEAVWRLRVCRMPLIVLIDSEGNNLYVSGPEEARGME